MGDLQALEFHESPSVGSDLNILILWSAESYWGYKVWGDLNFSRKLCVLVCSIPMGAQMDKGFTTVYGKPHSHQLFLRVPYGTVDLSILFALLG